MSSGTQTYAQKTLSTLTLKTCIRSNRHRWWNWIVFFSGTSCGKRGRGYLRLWGGRYEYYKICMECEIAFGALCNIAERVARAQLPEPIRSAMHVTSITALQKPNKKVRGISSGDCFRRLVAKTLARQYQDKLRTAISPLNFGLCNASGTDAAVHFLRYLSEAFPQKVIMSIDGVGAFDHVSRKTIFEQVMGRPELHALLSLLRQ